jgi:hypothetical protein
MRLVHVSLHMNVWVYPSNDLGLTGPTLSQLSSSPGLYRLESSSSWVSISNLVDGFRLGESDSSLPLRNLLNFLRGFHCAIPSLRFLARTHVRHGLRRNTWRISFAVTLVFFQRGRSPWTA